MPHCEQNREPGALAWPQAAQLNACGIPHCGQKRLSPGMSLLQLGQALVFAMADRISAAATHAAITRYSHSIKL
jgi:hypothetical protein